MSSVIFVTDDRETGHLESKPVASGINDGVCSRGNETDRSKPSWANCATAAGSMFEREEERERRGHGRAGSKVDKRKLLR